MPYSVTTRPLLENLTIEDVLEVAQKSGAGVDANLIRKAYEFAEEAHRGQTRQTGENYIQHPLHVARTIAELRLGTTAIVAALLHDVREDTIPKYYNQIKTRFGEQVNFLVQGVTKLSKVRKLRENRGSIEDLRNIFIAMTRDIRVIIIKLADRLHNLRTLAGLDDMRRERIARQTLDVYAPIADRLGMGQIKGELEDLAFVHAMPEKAEWVRSQVSEAYEERAAQCERLRQEVAKELRDNSIPVSDIHGRAKRLYSLYLKLPRYNNDITQIFDLVALRVIVPTQDDCYHALGVIHQRWRPLVGKIKDYCATPKANGYQSLHTTVIVGEGRFLEIQIRTVGMHERAERGVAASWAYAEAKRQGTSGSGLAASLANDHDIAWVEQLARWQQDVDTPEEFFQTLRTDFFRNRIFCLTPKGEVINLPEGGTPVDFAYNIHSSVGNRARAAKVNGRQQPLDFTLENGDIVDIKLGPRDVGPKREWLDFVKTNSARKSIKHWYNQLNLQRSEAIGRELLSKELQQLLGRPLESIREQEVQEYLRQYRYASMRELFIAIGQGERNPRQVVKRIFAEDRLDLSVPVRRQLNVKVPSRPQAQALRARCCRPIEGDKIIAVGTHARVLVHRTECKIVKDLPVELLLECSWDLAIQRTYRVWLEMVMQTYVGMFKDFTTICAAGSIPIHDISVKRQQDTTIVNLLVEITDADQLSTLIRKLQALPKMTSVRRRHS